MPVTTSAAAVASLSHKRSLERETRAAAKEQGWEADQEEGAADDRPSCLMVRVDQTLMEMSRGTRHATQAAAWNEEEEEEERERLRRPSPVSRWTRNAYAIHEPSFTKEVEGGTQE